MPRLTPRERDVLRLVCAGKTNNEIAADLGISAKTARTHTGMLRAKLGVVRRDEIEAKAKLLGVL